MPNEPKPPPEPERLWPGAVEAGLQKLPIVVDLRDDDQQTWMNQDAAARQKGQPLSLLEQSRVVAGRWWDGSVRRRREPPYRHQRIPPPG